LDSKIISGKESKYIREQNIPENFVALQEINYGIRQRLRLIAKPA
jgi:hypothetical protein